MTNNLATPALTFGCDPEFFLEENGKIVGAEKLIDIDKGASVAFGSQIIVDGVQAELNPASSYCREILAGHIQRCLSEVRNIIAAKRPNMKANFSTTVEVNPEEMDSLDPKSRMFGCAPSFSVAKEKKPEIDGSTYPFRSAGGHIHLGAREGNAQALKALREYRPMVNLLDILVGNTCVLIDRAEGSKKRREVYGRAGEYRTPSYGLEYRSLSNFWLRAYPLMSFVMSLSRLAVAVRTNSTVLHSYERQLLRRVSITDIRRAINENDYDLALRNFEKIKPWLMKINMPNSPLSAHNMADFEYFVSKGIDHWFKDDPITHWTTKRRYGWENFLFYVVQAERIEHERAEKIKPATT